MTLIDLDDARPRAVRPPWWSRDRRAVWMLIGLVVGALSTVLTGTAAHAFSGGHISARTRASIDTTALGRTASDAVDHAALRGSLIAGMQSMVLAWPSAGASTPREYADGIGGALAAGSYTLTTVCAGDGRVLAVLRVGSRTSDQIVDCSGVPTPSRLTLPSAGGSAEVRIVALDRELVATAFVVTRDRGATQDRGVA